MTDRGKLLAICVSRERGTPKTPIPACRLVTGLGIEGDGHAGFGHRQASVLAEESFARMRAKIPGLPHGAFAENLVTSGIDWNAVPIGRKVRFGQEAILQVTQRGKICHNPCAIYATTGYCIMPTEGTFLVVRRGGALAIGDGVYVDPELDRVRFAVVTVSDRSASGEREDRSGPALTEVVEEQLGATRVDYRIVPDEREQIAAVLKELCDQQVVDLVLTSGGTGLGPRDVTPEATAEVVQRMIPGMAEAMRAAGMTKTPLAMLSRGICGQRGYTLIINLSGSPKAVQEQSEAILPTLPHALALISGIPQDCAPKE